MGLSQPLLWQRYHGKPLSFRSFLPTCVGQAAIACCATPCHPAASLLQVGPLVLTRLDSSPSPNSAGHKVVLSFRGDIGGPGSLQALLEPLVPPGTPLVRLALVNCSVPPAALRHCPALASLTGLTLGLVGPEGSGSVAPQLQSALQQAPHMAALRCVTQRNSALALAFVPACIVQSTSLTRLELHSQRLTELPPGAYLQRELLCLSSSITGERMARLLKACTLLHSVWPSLQMLLPFPSNPRPRAPGPFEKRAPVPARNANWHHAFD